MERVEAFQAVDGMLFATQQECEQYEEREMFKDWCIDNIYTSMCGHDVAELILLHWHVERRT